MKSINSEAGSTIQRVRRFLQDLDDGNVSLEDADRIRDDLYELVSRVERMQELYPGREEPALSPDVCQLLKKIDRNKLVDRFPFLKAASFL